MLEALRDHQLALLTGNVEPVARLKMTRAGLGHFFPRGQGAYGSDHEDRAALPPLARRRAGSRQAPHPREETVVIGDTPRDIACARADGSRVVAMTTGPCSADELQGADAVVDDVAGLERALGYSDQ
jgi:phosphoglycolate phosphatase-like HAD superfamily hydrolase